MKTTALRPPVIDGTRAEVGIYENILAAYQCTLKGGKDRVTLGSRIVPALARLMKEGGNACANTARNSLVIVLALFFLRDNQPSFPGQDITALNPRERDHLLADLAGALPSVKM